MRLRRAIGSLVLATVAWAGQVYAATSGQPEVAASIEVASARLDGGTPIATGPVVNTTIVPATYVAFSMPAIPAPTGDNPFGSPCCTMIAPSAPPVEAGPPPGIIGPGPIAPIVGPPCCTTESAGPDMLPPCCQAHPQKIEGLEPPHDHIHLIEPTPMAMAQALAVAMPVPAFSATELRLAGSENVKPIHILPAPAMPIDVIALLLVGAAIVVARRRYSPFGFQSLASQTRSSSNIRDFADFRASRRKSHPYLENSDFTPQRLVA